MRMKGDRVNETQEVFTPIDGLLWSKSAHEFVNLCVRVCVCLCVSATIFAQSHWDLAAVLIKFFEEEDQSSVTERRVSWSWAFGFMFMTLSV